MKGIYTAAAVIIFVCMVLFPLFSMKSTASEGSLKNGSTYETSNGKAFRIYMTDSKKISEITAEDYVTGVVLAEMPAEYEPEALKAQAVVAYTYALYKSELRKDEAYDITDSHETDQAFLSKEQAEARFGEAYGKYLEKVSSAVKEVLGQALTYNGSPILAACHSVSGGRTESAESVWGGSYPYLCPVESAGDLLSPDYLSEATFSAEELRSALSGLGIAFDGDEAKWFGGVERTESGYVSSVDICGTSVGGSSLRRALGLRSTAFDCSYDDGKFVFTVRGYGHGVGMSQYGAQFMALQGSDYKEILNWYYKDCRLKSL